MARRVPGGLNARVRILYWGGGERVSGDEEA